MSTRKHPGSCHCGAVKFEVEIDATNGSRCNCTVCNKLGVTTAIAKPAGFTVLAGQSELGEYAWGGRTATRYFCKHCGITCFLRGHLEQLGGEYVSVSLNALDDVDLANVTVTHWDGRNNNWGAGARETPWPIAAVR